MTFRHAFAAVALATFVLPASARAAPEDVALRYVREHRSQLGLDMADVEALQAPAVVAGGNVTSVRFRQAVDGIPAADSEVRVNLGPDGRVVNVMGEPAHDLDANTTPAVSAGQAVRAVQADLGGFRALSIDKAAKGATRATTYSDGSEAELALDERRLIWRVTYRESSTAVWDAFVDARSGKVRRRVNMVKSDTNANVWDVAPVNANGSPTTRNLEGPGWIAAGQTRLSGPFVRAFMDLDGDDVATPDEEVLPGQYAFTGITGVPNCPAAKPCGWDNTTVGWMDNRRQDAVQAFYFANTFHDYLADPSIGFSGFNGDDPVVVQTDDGAGTGPDDDHLNNANMLTLPDGRSPIMQMYLFRGGGFRLANGGDDAGIVYHEYAHGLSNRLVTDAAGRGALNGLQAGAMGEGWSDWYAKDALVSRFPGLDTAAAGDVDMGSYVDVTPHTLRTQGLDCAVGASAIACPGKGAAGSGGYTYGDFGRIEGGPEVHSDGEIWAETLWDLRTAVTPAKARQLITDGMRFAPPEPSFLDARNGILLADAATGGGSRNAIWNVFRIRGMGYFASTDDASGVPTQDFSPPPAIGDPSGSITGTMIDAATGARIQGAKVAVNGLGDGPDKLAATTDSAGNYAIAGVPAHAFPSVVVSAPGYDTVSVPLTVPAGAAARFDRSLVRNWAALPGGASVTPGPAADEYADQGCGPDAALDQSQDSGWSTNAEVGGKSFVVSLPAPVDVTEFVADPAEACGDDIRSAAADYVIDTSQTSASGPWSTAAAGTFSPQDRHRLNAIPASAAGVRHVRLTIRSAQGFGAFFDVTEFGVHGRPAAQPAPPPAAIAVPVATPAPKPLDAPSFSFPQRGRTTIKFKVDCAAICNVSAKLTVDRPTASKLRLGKKLTVGSLTKKNVKKGRTTLTLHLSSKAKKALQKGPRSRRYVARIKVTAGYPGTKSISRSAQVTLRR